MNQLNYDGKPSDGRNDHSWKKEIKAMENDELIIEENTIYEIDLNCYECLKRAKQKQK